MKVIILDSPASVAAYGANIFKKQLQRKPDSVLGLATGSTPLALYKELIALNRAGEISFAQVATFNLDEYLGLDGEHPQSYRYFMNDQLFNHIDIDKNKTQVPPAMPKIPSRPASAMKPRLNARAVLTCNCSVSAATVISALMNRPAPSPHAHG